MRREAHPACSRASRVPLAAFLLCLLLIPALAGCEEWLFLFGESEQEQVQDTAQEWTEVHDLNPTNEDGSVNTDGVAKVAKRVVTGSTGDPEVDAALNSDDAILKIQKADELEERGWKENRQEDFDQAVALRPEDWKYRVSRAAWNTNHWYGYDTDKEDKEFDRAENLLGPDKDERIQYARYGIEMLERVKMYGNRTRELFVKPHKCRTVFSRLAHYYNVLADQTGDASARAMAGQYTTDLGQCPPYQ